MKIRTGFVSNSSSSSFIISRFGLTKEQIDLLLEFGFQYTEHRSPFYFSGDISNCWASKETNYLGLRVPLNQEDVAAFLVKHRIPFEALVDTGSSTWIYEGDTERVLNIPNNGINYAFMNRVAGNRKEEFRPILQSVLDERSHYFTPENFEEEESKKEE